VLNSSKSVVGSSQRLTLVPLKETDWPFFKALHQDQQVMYFMHDKMDVVSIKAAFSARLPKEECSPASILCWVIRQQADDQPIGLIGLRPNWIPARQGAVDVVLQTASQGKGFGKEALQALLVMAFGAGFHKMLAYVTVGNGASRALLQSCGFLQEGTLRENCWLHQEWHDDWVFSLLADEHRQLAWYD